MITLVDEDTRPIESFALAWRWTDERYAVLPANVLGTMRCLTDSKAEEIWNLLEPLVSVDEIVAPDRARIESIPTDGNAESVKAWLRGLAVLPTTIVVANWQPHLAAAMPWETFVQYWDDFCYPSSDDVLVVPLDWQWILAYWHFERMQYAVRGGDVAV